ncbi:molecular chaperone GrpE (heat shock protein) [Leptolyngbyaceae cyanobacterium JSC-12]|nr:molecular chaperone GrpE (heat shock protein) [Leptolyngbyaceae cyanobacterium JSC-12]
MIDEEYQVEGMQGSSSVESETTGIPPEREEPGDVDLNASLEDTPEASEGTPDLSLGAVEFPDLEEDELSAGQSPSGVDYAKLSALEGEIQSLKAQLEERTGQYMRIAADFDNYRKRTQREKEEFEQQIKCSTINELLPVVDNFERARSQLKPQTEQETAIHKSYQSVYKQLVDCLKRIGVSPMRSEGKEFDPTLHEAVMRQPTDEYPEGTVIEELQRGYMLGERVLRHALVKVAAPPEPAIASEGSDQGTADT